MTLTDKRQEIKRVWSQRVIPVVYRSVAKKTLLLRIPYAPDNMAWLRNGKQRKPIWDKEYTCWHLPKAWFNDTVNRCLHRFGKVYVIQPYRAQEKCAPACWNAKGHICSCSCMGEHHGTSNPDGSWFVVSDTFATQWSEQELACRLLTMKSQTK